MKKCGYLVSAMAIRGAKTIEEMAIQHAPIVLYVESMDRAVAVTNDIVFQWWPKSEGYFGHHANISPIPPQRIAGLCRDMFRDDYKDFGEEPRSFTCTEPSAFDRTLTDEWPEIIS